MKKIKDMLFRYRIFVLFAVILLLGLLVFFLAGNQNHTPPTVSQVPVVTVQPSQSQFIIPKNANTEKIWQIDFAFDTKTQQLSVNKITIQKGTANEVKNANSPYVLQVLDVKKHVIFRTSITLARQILYDVYFPPGATPSGLPQLASLHSLVAIPYLASAQTIEVLENNNKILSFAPPKEIGFLHLPSMVGEAYAAAACDLLHIVFISDGYADMNKFHTDAQKAESTFTSKAPFSSHSDIFDFKTVDNPATNPLGCKKNGALDAYCVYDTRLDTISKTVFAAYPNLPHDSLSTKIVVLVDGAPQPITEGNVTGYILGVANALGGQFGVFQDQKYFEATATMEVLGHDVGELYDRYIYPSVPGSASDMGKTIPAPYASNCSTNPNGESFWKSAGVTTAYKGCTSEYLYSPGPLTCGSQGSNMTIMSAAGCAGSQFDAVEQYYLQSVILPRYCRVVPTLLPTVSSATDLPNGGQGGAANGVTPAKTFTCVLDPQCSTSKTNLQLCQLKCTPQ